MATFSSTQPGLRARILPRFPAQVLAGTGITITKSGGTYVFAAEAYADVPITALETIPTARVLGRDSPGEGSVELLSVGGGLGVTGGQGLELTSNQRIRAIPVLIPVVAVGVGADIMVPFACTITQVTLMANLSGSVVVDIWKDTYTNFPPTVADSITAAAKPTISASTKGQNNTLVGWNTSILAGDILRFNVDSVTTITRLAIGIDVVTL